MPHLTIWAFVTLSGHTPDCTSNKSSFFLCLYNLILPSSFTASLTLESKVMLLKLRQFSFIMLFIRHIM